MNRTPSNRLFFLPLLRTPLAASVVAAFLGAAFPAEAAAQAIEIQGADVRIGPGPVGSPSEAARTAPRLDIHLDNSPMQNLPNEIANVTVAPDGRVWYQMRTEPVFNGRPQLRTGPIVNGRPNGMAAPTLPLIKEDIAAEFTQPSPQVRVLFSLPDRARRPGLVLGSAARHASGL